MSTYKRYFDKTKYMYFMKNEKIFNKYMTIWQKVGNIVRTNFNSEFIYNTFYP